MKKIEKILKDLRGRLDDRRYHHTLRVIDYGQDLARHYHLSVEKFKYAAALHDYCKQETDQKILEGIDPDLVDHVVRNQPNLGHGYLAAVMAQSLYDIHDREILEAIEDHTFGRARMSDLAKVLYLADHLEPNRSYVGVDALRQLAFKDLDEAVIMTATHTLIYELSQGHLIHEGTLQLRNHLLQVTQARR